MNAARFPLFACLTMALSLGAGSWLLRAQATSAQAASAPATGPQTAGAPKPSSSPAAPSPTPENLDIDAETEAATFTTSVRNILAPVTVLDRAGGLVDGIEPGRFHLYDNGIQQKIAVDVSTQPLSMVIAIQQSDRVEAVLTQIHKIGPLIQPLLTGDGGEAAILSFDSRLQVKQDFTNDPDKLQKAIMSIHAGNTPNRLIDAVETGVQMLKRRQGNRRRIILLISETRDVSSQARLRETVIAAQLANVTVYTVDISRIVTSLTSRAQPPAVDQMPPAAYNLPGGIPSTPTTVQHMGGAGDRVEFVPVLKELYLGTKRIFVENPPEVLTEATGGAQFTFKKERGLEDAIAAVGREIHSQYLISYAPSDLTVDGFHEIRVDVDLPDLVVRTRPGYYLAGVGAK
jgi:VWFA-related protein